MKEENIERQRDWLVNIIQRTKWIWKVRPPRLTDSRVQCRRVGPTRGRHWPKTRLVDSQIF